jgi:hypothetical protein
MADWLDFIHGFLVGHLGPELAGAVVISASEFLMGWLIFTARRRPCYYSITGGGAGSEPGAEHVNNQKRPHIVSCRWNRPPFESRDNGIAQTSGRSTIQKMKSKYLTLRMMKSIFVAVADAVGCLSGRFAPSAVNCTRRGPASLTESDQMQRVFWRLQQEAPLLKLEQVVAGLSDAMRITWAPCEYLSEEKQTNKRTTREID